MLKRLEIHNFRGIASAALDELARVNVLVGPNNSGKSTVLDAMFIAAHPEPEQAVDEIAKRRVVDNPRGWLIYNDRGTPRDAATLKAVVAGDIDRTVMIRSSKGSKGGVLVSDAREQELEGRRKDALERQRGPSTDRERRVAEREGGAIAKEMQAWIKERPARWPIPEVAFVDPHGIGRTLSLPDLYTAASRRGVAYQAKQMVIELFPDIQDMEILSPGGKAVVHFVPRDGGAMPIALAGDGVQLLFRLALQLATPAGGVALLEEPETHLHPSAIRQATRIIYSAAERGIQITISTHSDDMITALLSEATEDQLKQIAFYRVQLQQGELVTCRLSGNEAQQARAEISEDLR